MKNKLFASIPAIVFGILIAIAPFTFAKVCGSMGMSKMHMMHGACYYTGQAALGIGIIIALLGVVSLFVKAPVRAGISIAIVANSLLMIAVPTFLIGVCNSPMMKCNSVTRPTLIVLSALTAVISASCAYFDLKNESEN